MKWTSESGRRPRSPLLAAVAAFVVLSGVIAFLAKTFHDDRQAKEMADRKRAEEKLARQVEAYRRAEQKSAEFSQWVERISREQEERAAAALREAALKAKYPPARLESLSRWRSWGPVELREAGIECRLRTSWVPEKLNFRLALLGQERALDVFMGWRKFYIMFQDGNGEKLTHLEVYPSEFRWAPAERNRGIPTLELEKSLEFPVEYYDKAAQWNLMWTD